MLAALGGAAGAFVDREMLIGIHVDGCPESHLAARSVFHFECGYKECRCLSLSMLGARDSRCCDRKPQHACW